MKVIKMWSGVRRNMMYEKGCVLRDYLYLFACSTSEDETILRWSLNALSGGVEEVSIGTCKGCTAWVGLAL
jgi:hypothetical protein